MSENTFTVELQPFYTPLQVLWDYLRFPSVPEPCDCVIGFGNYNLDIPKRAAELWHAGYSDRLLFSGGLGRNTLGLQSVTEADRFATQAIDCGIPQDRILIENRSTNTAENIIFTRQLLEAHGIRAQKILLVHQPFMERRIAAAFPVYWPGITVLVTSPQVSIAEFLAHAVQYGITQQMAIEEIVGDFQRMELYAQKGWQLPQEIPADAWDAFHTLVSLGYGGQLA